MKWGQRNSVFFLVEDVRKVTFSEFLNEVGEFHRDEIERVHEPDVKHVHRQTNDFSTTHDDIA